MSAPTPLAHYQAMAAESAHYRRVEQLSNAAHAIAFELDKDRAGILTGDKQITSWTCNALLDHLTDSTDLPLLVRTALSNGADEAGKLFLEILAKTMAASAEDVARSNEVEA